MPGRNRYATAAFLLATPIAAIGAQAAAPATTQLGGIVYDSLLTGRPLPDAEVWVEGTLLTANTDDGGRFRFDAVPAGRYRVTFSHPVLDTIGVGAPPRTVDLVAGTPAELALVTPSDASVYAALCPERGAQKSGVLFGVTRDVDRRAAVPQVLVTAGWTEWNIRDKQGLTRLPREARVESDSAGRFVLCGVPADLPLVVRARAGEGVVSVTDVSLGERSFAVRSLYVTTAADTQAVAATGPDSAPGVDRTRARLQGRVLSTEGRPLADAQIVLLGAFITSRSDSAGRFTMSGLPAGAQTFDVRAIGFRPVRVPVELTRGETSRLDVTLDRNAVALAALKIVGRAPASLDDTGFETRRRGGFGQYITRDEIERRKAFDVGDLFMGKRGLLVTPDGQFGRKRIEITRGVGACTPNYYVNGTYLALAGDNIDSYLRPGDVEAVEIYVGASETPPRFSRLGGCGAIVIWTRRS